jgi:antitoxin YefM
VTSTTYSYAREHLADIWNEVEESQEEVVLVRRGHEDLALVPARELRSLRETAHLLSSPRNAARLLAAMARSREQGGETFESVQALAASLGLPDPAE